MEKQKDHIVDANKMMTALDWFVKEIQTRLINDGEVNYVELAKEAKEMEKYQILQACDHFSDYPYDKDDHLQYYNETYQQ
jgi:hypothetical protein